MKVEFVKILNEKNFILSDQEIRANDSMMILLCVFLVSHAMLVRFVVHCMTDWFLKRFMRPPTEREYRSTFYILWGMHIIALRFRFPVNPLNTKNSVYRRFSSPSLVWRLFSIYEKASRAAWPWPNFSHIFASIHKS